jgi:catechol 2,3-dioxygenase-like lactoylglutathione lyase family enzyme
MANIFSKLHHICIAVEDIEKAQAYYEALGIGPWIAYPPLSEYSELEVPNPEAFSRMQYRVCNLPNIQLQLCQPDSQKSPQREFLQTKGPGVFHLGFEVADADAAEAEARAEGIPVKMRGRRSNRSGFTYYDTQRGAGVVLLTRATPPGSKT